jgi:hydrogenase expression/formation protein
MDLEGLAKRGLRRGDPDVRSKLRDVILDIKENISEARADSLACAILEEAKATLDPKGEVFELEGSGVTMGEFGVGSRGAVRAGGKYIVLTVDGMHSRLSDYPFLAGFHVTRAALRDIYVMGSEPVALFSDIHLADDGDVSKLFDHIAGIAAVSELIGVPLITGSTLRIGGDMVIGDRLTGCVGAVGVAEKLTPRIDAAPGDVIMMTEGAGGGTVCAAALYYGWHDVVDETLNIKFLEASSALIKAGLEIHAMTDVTNGGIRGDAKEISHTAGVKLIFEETRMRSLVKPKVLEMLEALEIDYLGVSIDSLLIIAPQSAADRIMQVIRDAGVAIDLIGRVEEGSGVELHTEAGVSDFAVRFRESAYTPIKKAVGEEALRDVSEMERLVDRAAERAVAKKKRFVEKIGSDMVR